MTKETFMTELCEACPGVTRKNANAVLVEAFQIITRTAKREGLFRVPGFGTFYVSKHKARTGRNPRTGEPIKIKARRSMGFRMGAELKRDLRRAA